MASGDETTAGEERLEKPMEPSPDGSPAIDPTRIAYIRRLQDDGASDLLHELVGLFLRDGGPRIATMREAFEQNDDQTLARTAHALRGSCGNIGATIMETLCGRIEEHSRSHELSAVGPLLDDLEKEFERARDALENELR